MHGHCSILLVSCLNSDVDKFEGLLISFNYYVMDYLGDWRELDYFCDAKPAIDEDADDSEE